MKSFFRKLSGSAEPPNPELLAGLSLPDVDPILKYDDAFEQLTIAKTREEAIAIVRAYIAPKVEEKGADPVRALLKLEQEVPSRIDEIQLVREAYGLHRGVKAWQNAPMVANI